MTKDNEDKPLPIWAKFLSIAFVAYIVIEGLKSVFPFIQTEWGIGILFVVIMAIAIGAFSKN